MWQIEDLLRAYGLDFAVVCRELVDSRDLTDEEKVQARRWYDILLGMMRMEGVEEVGHLSINQELMSELEEFHFRLLRDASETGYGIMYSQTLPLIVQLRSRSGGRKLGEIETCLTALYGYLLLNLRGQAVSVETGAGIERIHTLLSFLSEKYKEYQGSIK
jgi:hypothetical protein